MALKRTRVTLTVDILRDSKLTEEEVMREFKRQVIEVHGPAAKDDDAHWFAADIHVTRTTPVPLNGARFTPEEIG